MNLVSTCSRIINRNYISDYRSKINEVNSKAMIEYSKLIYETFKMIDYDYKKVNKLLSENRISVYSSCYNIDDDLYNGYCIEHVFSLDGEALFAIIERSNSYLDKEDCEFNMNITYEVKEIY